MCGCQGHLGTINRRADTERAWRTAHGKLYGPIQETERKKKKKKETERISSIRISKVEPHHMANPNCNEGVYFCAWEGEEQPDELIV